MFAIFLDFQGTIVNERNPTARVPLEKLKNNSVYREFSGKVPKSTAEKILKKIPSGMMQKFFSGASSQPVRKHFYSLFYEAKHLKLFEQLVGLQRWHKLFVIIEKEQEAEIFRSVLLETFPRQASDPGAMTDYFKNVEMLLINQDSIKGEMHVTGAGDPSSVLSVTEAGATPARLPSMLTLVNATGSNDLILAHRNRRCLITSDPQRFSIDDSQSVINSSAADYFQYLWVMLRRIELKSDNISEPIDEVFNVPASAVSTTDF